MTQTVQHTAAWRAAPESRPPAAPRPPGPTQPCSMDASPGLMLVLVAHNGKTLQLDVVSNTRCVTLRPAPWQCPSPSEHAPACRRTIWGRPRQEEAAACPPTPPTLRSSNLARSVDAVLAALVSFTGVPIGDQILMCHGARLDPAKPLSAYKLPVVRVRARCGALHRRHPCAPRSLRDQPPQLNQRPRTPRSPTPSRQRTRPCSFTTRRSCAPARARRRPSRCLRLR